MASAAARQILVASDADCTDLEKIGFAELGEAQQLKKGK